MRLLLAILGLLGAGLLVYVLRDYLAFRKRYIALTEPDIA